MAFQPAMEEPSNITPSLNVSSSIVEISIVTCCHLPRGSVKRRSAYLTSLSLIIFITSLGVLMDTLSCHSVCVSPEEEWSSDRVQAGFPGSDPDGFFDAGDEDLAVANAPGLRRTADRLDCFLDHVVAEHNLDLHLGQEIHHVFSPPVKFCMPFLAAKTLGFSHSYALQPDLLQGFLDLVEFERLDHRLDLLHCISFPAGMPNGHSPCQPN